MHLVDSGEPSVINSVESELVKVTPGYGNKEIYAGMSPNADLSPRAQAAVDILAERGNSGGGLGTINTVATAIPIAGKLIYQSLRWRAATKTYLDDDDSNDANSHQ